MLSTLLVPISMVVANFSNLATQVVVPRFLSPSDYAYFALIWTTGQFLAVLLSEWARFGVLRFANGADAELATRRRGVLTATYKLSFSLICAVAIVLFVSSNFNGQHIGWAGVCFYAACQSVFEGRQAFSRASFDNRRYAFGTFLRGVLGLLFSGAVAAVTGNAVAVLLGIAGGYLLSFLLVESKERLVMSAKRIGDLEQFRFLFKYGLFAAASTILTSFFPAMVRYVAIEVVGLQNSGGVILALDLSQKAVAVVGMAVNLVVLQNSIKVSEFGGQDQKTRQTTLQIGVTAAFVFPAAVGFYLLHPLLADFLVPESYRKDYLESIAVASVCAAVLSFRMFALDALFFVAGKSVYSVAGPVVSIVVAYLAVNAFGIMLGHGGVAVAAGVLAGLVAGAGCSVFIVRSVVLVVWPWRELLIITSGCLLMYAVIALDLYGGGIGGIVGRLAAGTLAYFCVAYCFNIFSIRSVLKKIVARKSPLKR